MLLSPVVARRAARAGVLFALGTRPFPLAGQHVVGADVNAAAETAEHRHPLFFASAALAPAGHLGLSVLAVGARVVATYPSVENPGASGPLSQTATELASGLRYRIGRLALDAGVRHLASVQPAPDGGYSRNSALIATHWGF